MQGTQEERTEDSGGVSATVWGPRWPHASPPQDPSQAVGGPTKLRYSN